MNDSMKKLLLVTASMVGLISIFTGRRALKNPADKATDAVPVKWLQLVDMGTKEVLATATAESFKENNPPDEEGGVGELELPIKQLQKRLATLVIVSGGATGASGLREAVISFKNESGKKESLPVSQLLERYGMQAEISLLPILTEEKEICAFTAKNGDRLSAVLKREL